MKTTVSQKNIRYGATSIACAPGIAGIFRFVVLRIGNCDFKKIEDTMDKPLYNEMHERRQTRKARRMKKLRQATVEPVIGTLINFLGMRRVNTRGVKLANKCLLVAAVCYNLIRLLKWTADGIENAGKILAKCCFMLWHLLMQQGKTFRLAIAVSR